MADEKELKDQRVPIMMTPSELEAIDDWMFKNRIRSRGEAIRRLCQIGVAVDEHFTPMLENFLHVSSAAMDVAGNTHSDEDAIRVLDGALDFWQRFGKLRGVVLPMRKGKTIEEAFSELREIKEAWDNQDPATAKNLMQAWLKVARRDKDNPNDQASRPSKEVDE
ncbi:MAG: hypothetical protein WBA42_01550 [Mesorhizobium sp.]